MWLAQMKSDFVE